MLPKNDGPSRMPATTSPMTGGWPINRNAAPSKRPVTTTAANARRRCQSKSIGPSSSIIRHRPAKQPVHNRQLERFTCTHRRCAMRASSSKVRIGLLSAAVMLWALASVSAYHVPQKQVTESWFKNTRPQVAKALPNVVGGQGLIRDLLEGRRLFERDTFGGNG